MQLIAWSRHVRGQRSVRQAQQPVAAKIEQPGIRGFNMRTKTTSPETGVTAKTEFTYLVEQGLQGLGIDISPYINIQFPGLVVMPVFIHEI